MTDWTPAMVDERLVEAAAVLRRLPSVRMRGYFSTWPAMYVEFGDLVDQTPEPMRLPPPSAAAISRMEAAHRGDGDRERFIVALFDLGFNEELAL